MVEPMYIHINSSLEEYFQSFEGKKLVSLVSPKLSNGLKFSVHILDGIVGTRVWCVFKGRAAH